ncbi:MULTISPECIES: bifunctional [glutamate--ammonia ligase]-adenylyl-L-tyrosine phosphorylase/[glutamate--ammonia-ligase] adenylyltransferase [Idiomarina]|jgi:glutamate-ammonia-ligase adenylyltransferase|uniref:bifunctional [glutamate--ammonia ligase]-adenylyl-L-tyrosine phosphorylase/[glutamate--ammonia-ligase] adenylyltransferase n=1 Tax=Idiomarina TaxID=135575 RepID=UPI000C0B0E91|nr:MULTISPECIES: bifunctional [glutamate--ammonia ligase]-adenylyl-L-tyrosine phosphorylase/[glutamate--ammonia-ligase] adenylyltransferase [Idiomarina]MAC33394.1 bifunctional [glutamate--ammonia ligase]-adenylyl-L-tyrosine phosphorylase/[glutamate--ammonia-ligase] adenylyltransferase [Haliea sp.]MAO69161.1 bifunctional [glutamate--ammonia ligase]-adenylyl-L-tyrosine phosphorylase/[glutamate--ammonia-ligase] adenylyltransferase [Idiomarina sp.]MBF81742.1 bifunctional [glutamate--ammonia ligase]-|tara:strand:+ start:17634 stop:20480 length:2847 start_codon:yes stop_codon:yes gene_type:complete
MLTIDEKLSSESEVAWQRFQEVAPEVALSREQEQQLRALVAVSPFIARVAEKYPEHLMADFFVADSTTVKLPDATEYDSAITDALEALNNEDTAKKCLRQLRHCWMAKLAAADILKQISLKEALVHYSTFADAAISRSLQWLFDRFVQRHGKPLDADGQLLPLLVIGMGKLGGEELNFSSDIDLIFAFPEQGETQGAGRNLEHGVFYKRLAQSLIGLLDEATAEGQVFRVDMRLRPFGQSGPLVTSMNALEHYYQEQGRDWERYAMVKARMIGAEEQYQHAFQQLIRPFVYRRYIDFGAIEALRKMKLLITQETRRQGVKNNIKLGAGGIREVEFIVQAHQLIRGGQEKSLQTRSIYQAMDELTKLDLIGRQQASELLKDYEYLRVIEHRLQQMDDQQTQQLPADEINRMRLCAMLDEPSWQSLQGKADRCMARIHAEFQQVVGAESEDDEEEQSLQVLWQDMLDDDAAIEIIESEGVDEPQALWTQIKNFRQESRRRSSGPRGRSALARLMPMMLRHAIQHQHPERLLERLLSIIKAVMSRTAYIELLAENPGAREQLCKLCMASPWISEQLALHPILLDELIDPQQLYSLPESRDYTAVLREYLMRIPEQDLETQMDALRQAKQALQLKIAAADISGVLELINVSDHLSALAEAIIAEVVGLAWQHLTQKHGKPAGTSIDNTGFAVLAYGKLGGQELGYGSDLDLVFVTDASYEGQTDGQRPIEVQQFYLRLAQRVLHLFTTRTVAGILYDVDLRLRPSGQAGLLVTQVSSFVRYLREDAWTWELQALVRARPVFGVPALRDTVMDIRRSVLAQPRDEKELRQSIVDMREKMREHLTRKNSQMFDLKQDVGGIADIEFITQYLVLRYADKYPELCQYSDNIRLLTEAQQQHLLSDMDAQNLINAFRIFRCESHSLALQGEQLLEKHNLDTERQAVLNCWNHLLADH